MNKVAFEVAATECNFDFSMVLWFFKGTTCRFVLVIAADPGVSRTCVKKDLDWLLFTRTDVEYANIAIVLIVL